MTRQGLHSLCMWWSRLHSRQKLGEHRRTFNLSMFVFSKRKLKLNLDLGPTAGRAIVCSLGSGSLYTETSAANAAHPNPLSPPPPPTLHPLPPTPWPSTAPTPGRDSSVLEVEGHLCCLALEHISGLLWHKQPSVTLPPMSPRAGSTWTGTSDPYASSTREVLGATIIRMPNPESVSDQPSSFRFSPERQGQVYGDRGCGHIHSLLT